MHPFFQGKRGQSLIFPGVVVTAGRAEVRADENGETGLVGQVGVVVIRASVSISFVEDPHPFNNFFGYISDVSVSGLA